MTADYRYDRNGFAVVSVMTEERKWTNDTMKPKLPRSSPRIRLRHVENRHRSSFSSSRQQDNLLLQVGCHPGLLVRLIEQFLHCGLRKFRHNKSSVYRWYTQLDRRRFVYDTWDNGSRLSRVMVECTLSIAHCLRLNLQLHTSDLVRTCRISSFCTVAWQLARFQLARRIARFLGDSWASCFRC